MVDSLTSRLVKLLPSARPTGVAIRCIGITDGSSKRPRNPCGLKPQAITNAPNGFLDINHRIGGSKELFLAIWPFRSKDLWRFSHAVAVDISCCPISVVLFRFAPWLSKLGRRWRPKISSEKDNTMTKSEQNPTTKATNKCRKHPPKKKFRCREKKGRTL